MSDPFANLSSFQYVTLVDRAMTGGDELLYNGLRIPVPKGQIEVQVPAFYAHWHFKYGKKMVHTLDGQYVHRYALKHAPKDLVERLGAEVTDDSPIQIDHDAVEKWDAPKGRVVSKPVNSNPAELRESLMVPDAAVAGR